MKQNAIEPLAAASCSALVRRCDVCGIINAIDLDPTPQRWKDLQLLDHTVLTVTQAEAMKLWEGASRCDHKKFIADLRAQVQSQNARSHAHPESKPTAAENHAD